MEKIIDYYVCKKKFCIVSLPIADSTAHLIIVTKRNILLTCVECCFSPLLRKHGHSDVSMIPTESLNSESKTKMSLYLNHYKRPPPYFI